jgi:hypothetical protein
MAGITINLSIITLNVNGLNSLVKKHRDFHSLLLLPTGR